MALTCPLTSETEGLIGAAALAALKPGALLINVARGKVIDEAALLAALADGRVRAAALDCFHEEPLPPDSLFWAQPNVLITPHTAGETTRYEENVVDILVDNLERYCAAKRRCETRWCDCGPPSRTLRRRRPPRQGVAQPQ